MFTEKRVVAPLSVVKFCQNLTIYGHERFFKLQMEAKWLHFILL